MQTTSKKRSYSRYGIGLTVFAAIGWIILGLNIISDWTGLPVQEKSGDLLNWATLTVEVALAVIITGVVFFISKKQQDQIQELVEKQQQFLTEQKEFREKRFTFTIHQIRSFFEAIIADFDRIKDQPEAVRNRILISETAYYFERIRAVVELSSDVLDTADSTRILEVVEHGRTFCVQGLTPIMADDSPATTAALTAQIDDLLKILPNPPL